MRAESETLLVLESKCQAPLVAGDILQRPRLFRELDAWASRRLTAVQAPAGYGKTMLVADWLQQGQDKLAEQGIQVGWVSLDEEDDDPRQFMAYVTAALQPVIPFAAEAVAQILRHGQPDLQHVITILANGIGRLDGLLLLIVDDYHHIKDEGINLAWKRVLERGPANLHLMLLSRHALPPALGHMSGIGGLRILGPGDLRFDEEEVSRFVVEVLGYERPSRATLSTLATRSAGWITGLKLAAYALPAAGDPALYLRMLHGRNQWLSTYFRSEILAAQSAHLQTFLLQTSILDQLSAPLCAAVTGSPQTAGLLEQAVASNLFLTPTNAATTRFAYHDLFRQMLRAELARRCSAAEVEVLARRAAAWLEENNEIGAALQQYLRAGLYEDALHLVERRSLPVILSGDFHRALRWLCLLEKEDLPLTPRLLLDKGWIYLIADNPQTLQYLQSTKEAWRRLTRPSEPGDQRQQERMMQRAAALYLAGEPEKALSAAAEVGVSLSPDTHFLVRGIYHNLNHIYLLNYPEGAAEHGFKALRIFEENGWLIGAAAVTRSLGLYFRLTGDPREAMAFYRRALRLVKKGGQDLRLETVYIHLHLAELYYNLNRIDEARDELQQMIAKAGTLGEESLVQLGQIMTTLCNRAEIKPQTWTLEPNSAAWWDMALSMQSPIKIRIWAYLIFYWILAGEKDKAWQTVRQLPISLEDSLQNHQPHVSMALVSGYLARGTHLLELEPLMTAFDEQCAKMNRLEFQLHAAVLLAWYWQLRGDEAQAQEQMGRALDMAARTGYVRVVLDIPELRPLLALMDHPALQLHPELSRAANEGLYSQEFTAQEIEILRLVAQKRKNAEIAAELYISVSTVKWHLWNIYRKMDVKNRQDAVAQAQNLGLLSR